MAPSSRSRHHHDRQHDPSPSRLNAPPHPVPELQGPFEESMAEAAGWEETEVPSDAASRRTILLDAPTYQRVIAGRWKQKPGEKYHPLWKLVAQLSFGIHLLAENLARSDDDVMQILQTHVDDIDLFLERTTEDLTLAEDDIQERLRCLQLPLQHPKVFDRMLEDKAFRNSIVEGNEKIEHIVARTGCAMKDSLKDAQKGLDATSALERYMSGLEDSWVRQTDEHEAVFMAMLENVEGWRQAFVNLLTRGDDLNALLRKLTEVINQMQQRAGEVSRKLIRAQQKQGHLSTESSSITYVSRQSVSRLDGRRSATPEHRKPLPGVPNRASAKHSMTGRTQETSSSRPPTHQSHRPETAQSSRSIASHQSHEALRSSARNSSQMNANSKAPRMVEIKRSPRNTIQEEPPARHESSMTGPRKSRPADLTLGRTQPAPRSTSTPDLNGMKNGLGITQGATQIRTESKPHNAAHNLVGLVNGSGHLTKLPLTPSSVLSSTDTNLPSIHELDSLSTTPLLHGPTAPFTKENGGSPIHSPPSTPAWAKQTFELEGRNRAVSDKTAFRSHPPDARLGSPPVMLTSSAYTSLHHGRPNQSEGSSIGAPGPEVARSDRSTSAKSASLTAGGGNVAPAISAERAVSNPIPQTSGTNVSHKTFAAELEGSTPALGDIPLMLHPGVFTSAAVELEAPFSTKQAAAPPPPPPPPQKENDENINDMQATVGSINDTDQTKGSSDAAVSELSAVETQMKAAVRRSFIARNIELPGGPFEEVMSNIAHMSVQDATEKAKVIGESKEDGSLPNTTTQEAKVQETASSNPLLDLPASEKQGSSVSVRIEHLNQRYISSAQRSPALRKPVKLAISPVPSEIRRADSGSAYPKNEKRSSIASTASSQSQWRAFFKGQLSPAEFTASSPTLTNKEASGQKLVLEGRRGQMISPTLGWQWNPMTPDAEDIRRLTSTQ